MDPIMAHDPDPWASEELVTCEEVKDLGQPQGSNGSIRFDL